MEQRARQSLKGSGSREVKLPGTQSSGDEWFAPLTVTEHRMLLTRDLKQLASGKGLHRRACKHRLRMEAHRRTTFWYSHLASEGSHGLFPFCLAKPKSFFLKRKELEAGLPSKHSKCYACPPCSGFLKAFLIGVQDY